MSTNWFEPRQNFCEIYAVVNIPLKTRVMGPWPLAGVVRRRVGKTSLVSDQREEGGSAHA